MLFVGHCHCGNIYIEFETGLTPASLPLRACQCSFCRAHGAVATTDPHGRVVIRGDDPAKLRRYRFGLGITDFFICANCGVYLAAVMKIEEQIYASLNANVLERCAELQQTPQPVSYEGESETQRRARRLQHWTPAELVVGVL